MSERSYRIRTDVAKDKVVRVKTEQDYDFLEILSLKIKQEDAYKLHTSNYGVIVGRVLANDAFGIPNAKVSVFIELENEDKMNSEITNIYPYTSFKSVDSEGRRYNLLSDETTDECYQVVGTFPNKRLVLDNDTYLEVFDKYWKYTTVTNKSGDYMIFGVPKGGHQIHVDIDLSDIGILSQKPIDFIYKGYNETQFENAQQFKGGNNLDNLTQLFSQNQAVHVYPFWGDANLEEIAISRCDIQVQYKFEPTCVFFGAIMTDNYNNNIGHKCSASKYAGFNRHLVTGEGTIEMIRRTPDNLVEEFQIQGNRLIDGDGVWCYQIPMNLDFVGTDEFGNIVPTDDPKKGIPTRTSVRFRVSMQETGNEGVSRHRAKYLIPNVQDLVPNSTSAVASKPFIESGKKFDQCYEFGSATPDEYYRDLYWNKVYSVKNYIPRIQTNNKKSTQNYSAIRTVNSNNDVNPAPFNHARYRLAFAYRVLCMIMTIVFAIICGINALLSGIAGLKIIWVRPFGWVCSLVGCIGVSGGLTEDEDSNIEYFPCCTYNKCMDCSERGCTKETSYDALLNVVQQSLSQEYDTVNLDFYNDWLNGTLYMPLWFWKKTKKKKFLFGLFSKKAVNSYCSCGKNFPKLRVTQNCSLSYNGGNYLYPEGDKEKKYHDKFPVQKTFTVFGVIKEFVNKAGLNIYYYAPGIPNEANYKEKDELTSYVRLYSTDIILLGSLNSCDLDNYPSVFTNLPTTTANIPFIATIKQTVTEEEGAVITEGTHEEDGLIEVTGMDWLHKPEKHTPRYGAGLFMDLACNAVYTKPKSCVNIERLCELGVSADVHMEQTIAKNGMLHTNVIMADGMITRYELVDNETRAMFASLNNNGLKEKIYNPNTGYYTYKLRYLYPIDFDGHMAQAYTYTSMMDIPTYDNSDNSYVEFKFGPKYTGETRNTNSLVKFFYSDDTSGKWSFPVFNNSFYFYFGIHEGSTAIDKFNSRFYATCYRNEKYPFTLSVDTHPAKWCVKDVSNDYATINITMNGIKIPYSYTLYNEFNEEILQEDGVYTTELNFGYKVKTGGGEYEYTEKTVTEGENTITVKELIKNGKFTEFNTGEEVKNANGEPIYVTNGTYKIEVTDTNGNKLTQNILVEQVPINLVYETIELGDKYYNDDISKASDFCNQNQFFGEIIISKVVIDGKDFNINMATKISENEFELSLSNNGETECVLLQIIPQQKEGEEVTFTECTCNGTGNFSVVEPIAGGGIRFPIWKPGTFTMTVTQKCCEHDKTTPPCECELNDNTSTVMAVVKNGQTFNAYINEMPMKFILGKNEQISSYNKNFYKVGATTPKELPGWFNVHDEEAYCFSSTTMTYEDIWSDFVTVITEQNTENVNDMNYYLSSESIYNMLTYKFEKIFNMSKNVYVCGDQDNKMAISHTGGKSPILYRGHYPLYNEATSENNPDNPMTLKKFSSDGSVTLNQTYPNIIGYNYTYIDSETDMPTFITNVKEPIFNTIYDEAKKQGNYFAAFTRNGGVKIVVDSSGEEKCVYSGGTGVNSIKYQQIPYMTNPVPYTEEELICPNADEDLDDSYNSKIIQGSGQNKPYFRGEFVDRRLDYDFIIFTPYAGDDSPIISSKDNTYKESTEEEKPEPIWKKGRLSGHTFNGVEMAYNKDYEIIGYYLNKKEPTKSHLLEYYYGADVVNGTETCLRQFKFDKNFNNLLNCVCGNTINVGMMVTGYTEFQNQDIITYHNKDVKFKRFYKTILKCSNKKHDINDFYWAGKDTIISNKNDVNYGVGDGNIIGIGRNPEDFGIELCNIGSPINQIPNTMFSYNHSDFGGADKGRYNADFGVNNYPLKRLLDIGNIDSCEKLTFTCSSCSYEVDVDVEDASSNDIDTTTNTESGSVSFITGMTQECGETEFIVDCRNMINPVDSSLEECAANKGYNVLYTYNKNEGFFFSKDMRIKCKVKNDTYNTTHSSYSYNPILFRIKRRDKDENAILELKHNSNSISDMEKEIRNNYRITNFSYDKDSVKDIKRISKKILFMTLEGDYWVQSNDDKKIAYDDNSNVKNVIYNVDVNDLKKNGDWFDVVGVLLKRNYINNSGDNLTKKISTLQVTSIYDVRRFEFELYCASEVRYIGTEVENKTEVGGGSVSVPNLSNDSEGNLTSNGSSPSEVTGMTGETESTATTVVQRTIYTVYTYIGDNKNKLINYNQQFYSIGGEDEQIEYNTDGLSAIFAIGTKFTSDVTISNRFDERYPDYLAIDFDIYWSGDLADKTLEKAKNDTARLYIKMPNKLIYQLNFNIKDFEPFKTDECKVDSTPPKEEEPTPSPELVSIINSINIANNLPMEGGENLKVRVIAGTNNYYLDKGQEQAQTIPLESGYNISVSVPKACLYRSDGQIGESSFIAFHISGSNIQWEGINENCGTFSDHADEMKWRPSNSFFTNCISSITYKNGDYKVNITITIVEN